MHRLLALLFVHVLNAAGFPDWLRAYPEAPAVVVQTPGMVTSSYSTPAKPDAVIEHYRRQWETAGLPFTSNFNGVGTSIRAALPDCDLLIQVREDGTGSNVKATCAARNQAPDPTAGRDIISNNGSTMRGRLPQRPVPFSQRDPHTAAVLANAEAESRARTMRMGQYDRPVFPQQPRDPEGIPLAWPSWLVHMPGASSPLNIKASVNQDRKNILTSSFRSVRPMSEIHIFYEDLLKANGFPVGQSRLQTGQTLGGVTQNASGMVNGRYEPYGVAKGGMSVEVRFSRSHLNEPIRVTIEVKLIQYYPKNW